MQNKTFRNNGARGALLDEYEGVIAQLKAVLSDVTPGEYTAVADTQTQDEDCRSIQTICLHVLRAGYGYASEILKHQGVERPRYPELSANYADIGRQLDGVFQDTEAVFDSFPDMDLEEHDEAKKMKVRWGQTYDIEQLMEHAIVHVMRHRRQIERFKLRLRAEIQS